MPAATGNESRFVQLPTMRVTLLWTRRSRLNEPAWSLTPLRQRSTREAQPQRAGSAGRAGRQGRRSAGRDPGCPTRHQSTRKTSPILAQEVSKKALWRKLGLHRINPKGQEALAELAGKAADLLAETLVAQRATNQPAKTSPILAQEVSKKALWRKPGLHRINPKGQEALAELAGKAADLLAETLVAQRATNQPAKTSPILAQEVSKKALWRKLGLHRINPKGQEALAELAGKAADLLAETLVAQCATNQPAKTSPILAQEVSKKALWRKLGLHRINPKGQEALAELAGKAADLLAETLVAQRATNQPAKTSPILAQEVSKKALWRKLGLHRINPKGQEALAELAGKAADLLAETLVAQRATNQPAKTSPILAQEVSKKALWRKLGLHRINPKGQEALAELAGKAADLLAETLVAQRATNQPAKTSPILAQEVSKKALWRKLGLHRINPKGQEALAELAGKAADLLAETLVAQRATNQPAKTSPILAQEVSKKALWRKLGLHRINPKGQEALAELAGKAADLLAETLVAQRATNQPAKTSPILAQEVSKKALWRKLGLHRINPKGQEAAEHAPSSTADLPPDVLVAKQVTYSAAG